MQDLGGVFATEACTRATRSLASDYGNVASERFAPADIVLDAETVAGTPYVTAALARAQGYELVPVVAQDDGELALLVARLGRDTATVFADSVTAIQSGTLADGQRELLMAELDAVRRDAAQGIWMLRRGATP